MTVQATAYIFVGCGVWAVLMGAMIVHCFAEELDEADHYKIKELGMSKTGLSPVVERKQRCVRPSP